MVVARSFRRRIRRIRGSRDGRPFAHANPVRFAGGSPMTPVEYLREIVEPNLAALAADYGSIRHNLNVVHAVDALAAHVFYASNGAAPGADDTLYRAELAKLHPEFALLRDIAKAVKHVL